MVSLRIVLPILVMKPNSIAAREPLANKGRQHFGFKKQIPIKQLSSEENSPCIHSPHNLYNRADGNDYTTIPYSGQQAVAIAIRSCSTTPLKLHERPSLLRPQRTERNIAFRTSGDKPLKETLQIAVRVSNLLLFSFEAIVPRAHVVPQVQLAQLRLAEGGSQGFGALVTDPSNLPKVPAT